MIIFVIQNIDAKEAIEKAKAFLEEYRDSFRLISTTSEDNAWIIICDVGFLNEEVKEIKVDAVSGKILGFIDVRKN